MKKRLLITALVVAAGIGLAGCAGPQISDYAQEKPVLDLRQYFNGTLDAYGIFTDRSGKAVMSKFGIRLGEVTLSFVKR